ncbi:MAG: PAS domain-containing protein [Alphaproteobacteria bacterium]|nr:PAS domain-containing protein [Alphaproteobacteria bacterium]
MIPAEHETRFSKPMNIYKVFFLFFAGIGFIVFSPILIIFLDTINAFHTSDKIREQNQIVNQTRLINYSITHETEQAMSLIAGVHENKDILKAGWKTVREENTAALNGLINAVMDVSTSPKMALTVEDIKKARQETEKLSAAIEKDEYVHPETFLDAQQNLSETLALLRIEILEPQSAPQFAFQQSFLIHKTAQNLLNLTSYEGNLLLTFIHSGHPIDDTTMQRLILLRNTAKTEREQLSTQIEKINRDKKFSSETYGFSLFYGLQDFEDSFKSLDDMRRRIYASSVTGESYPVEAQEWKDNYGHALESIKRLEDIISIPAESALQDNLKNLTHRLALTTLAGFVAIGILYILFLILKVRILKPIGLVTKRMTDLAAGDLELELPETYGMDEVAEMIEALKIFKQTALNSRRLATIPERNPDPIIELNENGMITYMNDAAIREFPNMYMVDGTVHPIFKDFVDLQMESLSARKNTVLHIRKVNDKYYERYTTFVELHDQSLIRVFLRDITEKMVQESALLESQERAQAFMNALEASKTGLVILLFLNGNWVVDYVNASFMNMTGYLLDELRNQPFNFLSGEKTDLSALSFVKTRIERRVSASREILCYKKDNQPFWGRMQVAPILNRKGKINKYSLMLEDISEDRDREEGAKKQQNLVAIGEMAGGMAHEINNALQPILGLSEALTKKFSSDPDALEEYELSKVVYEYALFAKNILTDMLSFTRQESGALTPVKAYDILDQNLKLLQDGLPAQVKLVCENLNDTSLPESSDAVILINQTGFFQIMTNLIKNACHAMNNAGTVTLGYRERLLDEKNLFSLPAGHYFQILVKDTGCGMDEKTKAKIFEPFFSTKQVGEGTGLGLSVVYGILQKWNGSIHVESMPGKGTIFTILIPIQDHSSVISMTAERKNIRNGVAAT